MNEEPENAKTTNTLYRAKVAHCSSIEHCVCQSECQLKKGDFVIIPTRYGDDLARISGVVANDDDQIERVSIRRKANEEDIQQAEKNSDRSERAYRICYDKIKEHGLKMKLVSAHHLIGESKILFYFTAESRVDFRALVKDLVSEFKTRIELRQIGVRDESRVLGGIGVCGRGYCCHTLTDKLNPVSIKMAKKQNLSLNSLKISGPCGRLLCCLAYEYDNYKRSDQRMPKVGSRVVFEGETCEVVEVNALKDLVRLKCDSGRYKEIPQEWFEYKPEKKLWAAKSMKQVGQTS